MKKYIISIVCALCAISGTAWAGPVDSQDAKQKAAAFLQKQAAHAGNARRAAALRAPQLNEVKAFGEALHVFNVGGDNGFVIVSGDDRTDEILGYVDEGSFDMNNLPANAKAWITEVVKQINSGANLQKSPRKAERADIPALMTTKWDQYGNYSRYIFDDDEALNSQYGGGGIMTGCVATAMAQVLYNDAKRYYATHGEYPGPTSVIPSYTIPLTEKVNGYDQNTTYTMRGKTLPELPSITFNWAAMEDDITSAHGTATETAIKAVDDLMKYCGRALQMCYDAASSSVAFVYIPQRIKLLGVNPYIQNMDRAYFTTEVWEETIYSELKEGRAVPYTGVDDNGEGHAYVCDGYQASTGLWHINWGWSGTADGWFSLSVLQPSASGGSMAGGTLDKFYNGQQQITINCSFDTPENVRPALCYTHVGGDRGYDSYSNKVTYLVYNLYGGNMTFDGAWGIENADGSFTVLAEDFKDFAFNGFYTSSRKSEDWVFYPKKQTYPGDGTYEVKHLTRPSGTTEWNLSYGTDEMWLTVTVSGGSVTNVIAHPQKANASTLSIGGIDFEGEMEANQDNTVIVTVNNAGDDYWGNVRMYYSTSSTFSSYNSSVEVLTSIKPGESVVRFPVKLAKGEYNLWFVAETASSYVSSSDVFGTGKMLIGYGADANYIQAGNLKFDGQTGTTLSVKSVNGQLEAVTGTFEITNNTGHTYSNTYYINVEYGSGSSKKVYATAEVPFSVEEGTTIVPFSLGIVTGLVAERTYKVRLYSKSGSDERDIASSNMGLVSYFRYWLTDGTLKDAQEPSYYVKLPEDAKTAAAIDCRGLSSTSYMDNISNKNCVIYISESQKPTSSYNPIYGCNLVIDGVAETMNIDANYGFYAPEAFEAKEISFTKKFENGRVKNAENPCWYTIILPFEVNSVKNGDKNLKWFKSANDKRCHFWLMELTGATDNALTFDYATTFEANKPYIISVPGEGWGDNWNLTGKEITFRGLNVDVPVTVLEPVIRGNMEFTGTYTTITTNGYIMNAEGTEFKKGEGTVNGYNAYFAAEGTVNALRIVIEGEEATGIEAVDNSQLTNGNEPIYNLNGQRLEQKQRGVNIVGGRKIVVK